MKTKLLLGVALLSMSTLVSATNYYAAPGAKGDGKSISNPGDLNTLAAAKDLVGGDSLFLLDGVYYITSSVDVKNVTASAEKNFFIGAYPGAHPIIDGGKLALGSNGNVVRIRKSYVHVKGITVRYGGYKGLYVAASNSSEFVNNVTIEQVVAHDNYDTGIQIKNGEYCTVKDCDSYNNFDYNNGGGNADGFCDKQFAGAGNTYINCRAWSNSDDGWDLYKRETSSPIIFINCITYNNSPQSYTFYGHPRFSDGTTKTNNGNMNGFKLGGAGVATDVTMYRCLAIANTKKGFDQNYTQGDVKLYNCTGVGNNSNFNFHDNVGQKITCVNCISFAGKAADEFNSNDYTHSSNSWDMTGMAPTAADFQSTDATLSISERNADGSLNIPTLMHLAAGSKFIDAGEVIPGYSDYTGSKPDLGWKEYEDVPTAISETVAPLKGARRLNIYDMNGKMVGMVSDGNIDQLNLKHGIYIVRDFDTNKAVKILK